MDSRTTGGYDGEANNTETVEHSLLRWDVIQYSPGFSSKVFAQLRCNGELRGTVTLNSEEEFEWLKDRFAGSRGDFKPTVEEEDE